MIVATAMLVFLLLVFAPIRVKLYVYLYPADLRLTVKADVCAVKVFDENIVLSGKYLHCNGTLDSDVDITAINGKNGVDLFKCITVDRVFVSVQNNMFNVPFFVAVITNVVMALSAAVMCNATHCQVQTRQSLCQGASKLFVGVALSANVAELSFCLAKQGVQQWKTRKSKK